MTSVDPKLKRRLKLSGGLIGTGLAVEALTMAWSHPTAFLAFLFVGGALVALGVLLYLITIASAGAIGESREP
jgi:hypothetical protein